jgi:hypothetical protein
LTDATPREAAERMEEFTGELGKSLSRGLLFRVKHLPQIQLHNSKHSLQTSHLQLTQQRAFKTHSLFNVCNAELQQRDYTNNPLSTSFAAFDLEAPSKLLTPRPTPLRNRIPRKKGVGTSHRVKRILGYTGTGTGGVGNTWPGITESTTTAFGSINYQRGPQIAYAADDLVLPYNSYSLSDAVSFDANFSGLGYQDLRQLSSTSTLFATMLMEERMMLMARGTASDTQAHFSTYIHTCFTSSSIRSNRYRCNNLLCQCHN